MLHIAGGIILAFFILSLLSALTDEPGCFVIVIVILIGLFFLFW